MKSLIEKHFWPIITTVFFINLFCFFSSDFYKTYNRDTLVVIFIGVFQGFLTLLALLGFIVIEKTKPLINKILINKEFLDIESKTRVEIGAYKLWLSLSTFNPEVLRFFKWSEIDNSKLLSSNLYEKGKLQFEGKNYKIAFERFVEIIVFFEWFFWITVILLFLSLVLTFICPFLKTYYIIFKFAISTFILFISLSLVYALMVIQKLFFYNDKKYIKELKEDLSKEAKIEVTKEEVATSKELGTVKEEIERKKLDLRIEYGCFKEAKNNKLKKLIKKQQNILKGELEKLKLREKAVKKLLKTRKSKQFKTQCLKNLDKPKK